MLLSDLFEYRSKGSDPRLQEVFDEVLPYFLAFYEETGNVETALDHLTNEFPQFKTEIIHLYVDLRDSATEYTAEDVLDERGGVAWKNVNGQPKKQYRCGAGPRKGRVVAKPGQCFAPPDIKKRFTLKKTKARMGKKMARKRKKTMKTNPGSKRVQALNRKK